MNRAVAMAFVVALLPGTDTVKGAHDRLQGTWTVASFEDGGRKAPEDKVKAMKVVIAGNKLKITEAEKAEYEITFKTDPSKQPKQIDLTVPRNKGKANLGIYELEGDRLTICYNAQPDGERATAFESKRNSPNVVLMILKRKKQ